jgi:hypothetical protein
MGGIEGFTGFNSSGAIAGLDACGGIDGVRKVLVCTGGAAGTVGFTAEIDAGEIGGVLGGLGATGAVTAGERAEGGGSVRGVAGAFSAVSGVRTSVSIGMPWSEGGLCIFFGDKMG